MMKSTPSIASIVLENTANTSNRSYLQKYNMYQNVRNQTIFSKNFHPKTIKTLIESANIILELIQYSSSRTYLYEIVAMPDTNTHIKHTQRKILELASVSEPRL